MTTCKKFVQKICFFLSSNCHSETTYFLTLYQDACNLGPSNVGKSWLLQRIIEGDLAFSALNPTWPDLRRHSSVSKKNEEILEQSITITCNSQRYRIVLNEDTWSSTDQSENEKEISRSLVKNSHVIAICFSLNDEKSLEEILTSDFPLLIDCLG